MSFFSIIIPTFNSEATLFECLKSVLIQSFTDYEILVQDGGSTDQTQNIVTEFNDKRIHFLSEKDGGVYDAMNKAVSRSQGSWLHFLGSDDSLYAESVLADIARQLEKTAANVVYGDVKVEGDLNNILAKSNGLYRGDTPLEELFYENICHQAIFYRASLFRTEGFDYDLNYPILADYMLNLKLASRHSFAYVPIIVANYRYGGLSAQVSDHKFNDDRWVTIVKYYGKSLDDSRFYVCRSDIRRTAKKLFKQKNFSLALLSMKIYLSLKRKGK